MSDVLHLQALQVCAEKAEKDGNNEACHRRSLLGSTIRSLQKLSKEAHRIACNLNSKGKEKKRTSSFCIVAH